MQYKSVSCPQPSKGLSFKGVKKIVVPEQGFSLKEILERFTRGEKMPVGFDGTFNEETEVDLEKMKYADLTEKADYIAGLKATQDRYDRQQKALEKAAKEKELADAKAAEEKRIMLAAKKLAAKYPKESAK